MRKLLIGCFVIVIVAVAQLTVDQISPRGGTVGQSPIIVAGPVVQWGNIAGYLPPVAATFSAAATTGTLTHNFASASHVVQCVDANNLVVIPSSLALAANADTLGFTGGLTASTTCIASR